MRYRIGADGVRLVVPAEKSVDRNQKLEKGKKRKFKSVVGEKTGERQEVVNKLFVFVEEGAEEIQSESNDFDYDEKPD